MLVNLLPRVGRALVVGAGPVGLRKARKLVEDGFKVTVVSPEFHPDFAALKGLRRVRRAFADEDLQGIALVFACTEKRAVNCRVGRLARARGLLACVCDAPDESTFHGVASFDWQGDTIGISTRGQSPGRAARIKQKMQAALADSAG